MKSSYRFQLISHGILALFLGLMGYVTYIAYTRTSGSTGVDMSLIQKKRYDVYHPAAPASHSPPLPYLKH